MAEISAMTTCGIAVFPGRRKRGETSPRLMVYTIQSSKRFRGYRACRRAFLSKLVPGSIYVRGGGTRLTIGFARFHRSFKSRWRGCVVPALVLRLPREQREQISHRPVGSVSYEQTVYMFTQQHVNSWEVSPSLIFVYPPI